MDNMPPGTYPWCDPAEDPHVPEVYEWTSDLIDEVDWEVEDQGVPHDDWSDAHVIGGWLFGRDLTQEEIQRLTPEQEAQAIANYFDAKS